MRQVVVACSYVSTVALFGRGLSGIFKVPMSNRLRNTSLLNQTSSTHEIRNALIGVKIGCSD